MAEKTLEQNQSCIRKKVQGWSLTGRKVPSPTEASGTEQIAQKFWEGGQPGPSSSMGIRCQPPGAGHAALCLGSRREKLT